MNFNDCAGTYAHIDTYIVCPQYANVGDIYITPQPSGAHGYVRIQHPVSGYRAYLQVYDQTSSSMVVIYHDGTDGRIETNAGQLILNPQTSVSCYGDLRCYGDLFCYGNVDCDGNDVSNVGNLTASTVYADAVQIRGSAAYPLYCDGDAYITGKLTAVGGVDPLWVPDGIIIIAPISRPKNPKPGQIYFDKDTKHFYGFNGKEWKQLD